MKLNVTAGWFYGALVVLLCVWILRGFLEPVLAACALAGLVARARREAALRAVA